MADWEKKIKNEQHLRQFAGLVNGHPADKPQFITEEQELAELKKLTSNDGWEVVPAMASPAGRATASSDGWEEVVPTKAQKTSWKEDLKLGLAGVGNIADKGLTLAAATISKPFAPDSEREDMFRNMDEREKQRNQWANPNKREQGVGGALLGTAATLPMQVVSAPLSAIDTAVKFIQKGESLENAYKAAGIDAAFTAAGIALPAGVGKTLLQKALTGGAANVVTDFLGRKGIQSVAQNQETKDEFAVTPESMVVSGVVGAGTGAMMGRKVKPNADTKKKLEHFKPKQEARVPQLQNQNASEILKVDSHGQVFKGDENGPHQDMIRQQIAEYEAANRPLPEIEQVPEVPRLPEEPQGEVPLPLIPTDEVPSLSRFQEAGETLPQGDMPLPKLDPMEPQSRGLLGLEDAPPSDGGVRHTDPSTGGTVQGMAREVPTVDFPLKTEMLDSDASIQQMREFIAREQANADRMRDSGKDASGLDNTVNYLKEQFGEYLDKGYGVKQPGDAYPALFESGAETKLPIQQTHGAGRVAPQPEAPKLNGFGRKQSGAVDPKAIKEGIDSLMERLRQKNDSSRIMGEASGLTPEQKTTHTTPTHPFKPRGQQGGAIDPQAIRDGVKSLRDRFKKKGVPDALASRLAQEAGDPKKEAPVLDSSVVALRESRLSKGLGDVVMIADRPVSEVQEVVRQWGEDIERKPVQEAIENGGVYRGMDTKHPLVKYATERLNRAQQAGVKWVRDLITGDDGLKNHMRAIDPTEKGEIWQLMQAYEGQRHFSRQELLDAGFNEKQADFYQKFRDVDEQMFNMINDARRAKGLPEMDRRIAHIAGRFTGDFRVFVKRPKLNKSDDMVLDKDGNMAGEAVAHIGANTRRSLNNIVKQMKAAHPDWEFGEVQYKRMEGGNSMSDKFEGYMELLNIISKGDSHMKDVIDTYADIVRTESNKYLSTLNHAKPKKSWAGGLKGSEGNKEWLDDVKNAEEGMKSHLSYLEQGISWVEMQKAIEDVKQVQQTAMEAGMDNAAAWTTAHINHTLGRQGKLGDMANWVLSEVGKNTGLGHTNLLNAANWTKGRLMQKYMGFWNIPFTVTQLMQPLQSIPPMALLLKNRGVEYSAAISGTKAMWTMMKLGYDNSLKREGAQPFTGFELEALDYAHKHSVFDVQLLDHTKDINQSKGSELFDKYVAEANIRWPEMFTRGTAYMFYVHALKDTGMSRAEIFGAAENLTRMSMVDYTPHGRPKMYNLGWMGDMASTLTRYKHGNFNQLTLYAREANHGLRRGEFRQLQPMLAHFTAAVAFGGLKGIVAYNSFDLVYQQLSEAIWGEPDTLTDMLTRNGNLFMNVTKGWINRDQSAKMSDALTFGAPSLLGVDMSSRFSNAKLIPESTLEFLFPFGTGLMDMGASAWQLAKQPNEWNAKVAAKTWVPSSLTGAAENMMFTEDKPDGTKHVLNSRVGNRAGNGMYDRDESAYDKRMWGFRDLRESKELDRVYQRTTIQMKETEMRGKIVEKAFKDRLSGNLTAEKLKEYSQKYVALKGNPDNFTRDLVQKIEDQKLTAEQRLLKQNSGDNPTAAQNLKAYMNEGYNK